MIETNNLLQGCETLAADFNDLDDYFEKRDFVKQFLKDLKIGPIDREYKKFIAEKIINRNTIYSHYPKNVNQLFLDSIDGEKKTRFVAYHKAIGLIREEFNKIKPAVMCELTANIIIGLYEDDTNNQYKELIQFANLLESETTQRYASKLFYKKCNTGGNECSGRIDTVTHSWYECLSDVRNKYFLGDYISRDSIRSGLRNKDFIEKHKINYKDLAAKIKEHTNKIINNKATPPPNPKTPTDSNETATKDKPKTEIDFIKKLNTIAQVLIYLEVKGILQEYIKKHKTESGVVEPMAIVREIKNNKHFKYFTKTDGTTKEISYKSDGSLADFIRYIIKPNNPKSDKNPFRKNSIEEYNTKANFTEFTNLNLQYPPIESKEKNNGGE